MDAYDKQFTDRALSDLTRIYRDEEDPIGEEETPKALSNSIFANANLAFNPSIVPVSRRYVALEAASKLLIYAAKLHKEIKAETGESLGENEQVSAEEETENWQVIIRTDWSPCPLAIFKNLNKSEALDAGRVFAEEGNWVKFNDCERFIFPKEIIELRVEKMADGEG